MFITEPPSAPVISVLNSLDLQAIDITWKEPFVTNGGINGYILNIWIPSNSTHATLSLNSNDTISYINVSVQAVNNYGISKHSEIRTHGMLICYFTA